jgi:hypothetical protein
MPRAQKPPALSTPPFVDWSDPALADREDWHALGKKFPISENGWAQIEARLADKSMLTKEVADWLRPEIIGRLTDYAYFVQTSDSGPTLAAICGRLKELRDALERYAKLASQVDWWTAREAGRAIDVDFRTEVSFAIEHLKRTEETLRSTSGRGRRKRWALRFLVSELAVYFWRSRPRENEDWREFVHSVLAAAGIKHPSHVDSRSRARFDALVDGAARDYLNKDWAELDHTNDRVAEEGRAMRRSGVGHMPTMGQLLLKAAKSDRQKLPGAPARGRPGSKKGT